jgi:hypothetical protein
MQNSETFWAYLAGLFDGEGHIGLYKKEDKKVKCGQTWMFVSSIINTDKTLIESIYKDLGIGYIMVQKHTNNKHSDSYRVAFSKKDLKIILPKMLPYLRGKKIHVELILKALPVRADREQIYQELKKKRNPTSSRGRPKNASS